MIIASVSGGLSSGEMLRRLVNQHGAENVTAIFADVKGYARSHAAFSPFPVIDVLLHERFGGESPGLYRFLWHLSYALDVPIIRLDQWNTIYAHMVENKAFKIPNPSGVDFLPCSLNGKREIIAAWVEANAPQSFTMALGFDWSEATRRNPVEYWWRRRFPNHDITFIYPLLDKPYTDSRTIQAWMRSQEIETSDSYDLDYEHDNCRGFCVNMGIGQAVLTRKVRPGVFGYNAYMERVVQRAINSDATILKDQRAETKKRNDGKAGKLSLRTLGKQITDGTAPKHWTSDKQQTGCACFTLPGFESVEVAKPKTRRKREIANKK
jgi:hypothetical protein